MWRTVYLALISGFIAPLHLDADDHGAKGKVAPEKHAKAEPKCPDHVAKARPRTALGQPGRPNTSMSMPEFFMRMGQGFATNPAGAFPSMLKELGELEGPALEGTKLSLVEEREAGRKARDEYLRQAQANGHATLRDAAKLAKLRALVDEFAPMMKHRDRYPKIEITLIDAPIPDGQAFPGGFLVFTSALLEGAEVESAPGVVAHELAHLELGHLYQYAKRGKLAESTYASPPGAGATFDQSFTKQMALLGLLMNPYRPEHELEADCVAVTWMERLGHDPMTLADFFERLHRRLGDQPNDPVFGFALGRSHPYSLDRKSHVERRVKQLRRAG